MGKCEMCGKKTEVISKKVLDENGKYLFKLEVCKKCLEKSKSGMPCRIK